MMEHYVWQIQKTWIWTHGLGIVQCWSTNLVWDPGLTYLYYKTKMMGAHEFYSYLWKTFMKESHLVLWPCGLSVLESKQTLRATAGKTYMVPSTLNFSILQPTVTFCFHKSKDSSGFLLIYNVIFWKKLRLYLLVWIPNTVEIEFHLTIETLQKSSNSLVCVKWIK